MGIGIDKKKIEQEDSETDGNKYRQEDKIEQTDSETDGNK